MIAGRIVRHQTPGRANSGIKGSPYDLAWHKLCAVVDEREKLITELGRLVAIVEGNEPAEGFLVTLDAERARALIEQIEALRPAIDEAPADYNARASEVQRLPIAWRELLN